jgi:lipoyl(octanoyl) transferase
MPFELKIRRLQTCDYLQTWQAMKDFTDRREADTPDEIWLLEHFPVFTQGLAGKSEHLLNPGDIPVIQTDRGGQVTYHGPGQLVVYTLFDLRRLNLGIRQLVRLLEQTVIGVLTEYGINAQNRCDAPGVYVNNAKICSIGLRVRRGCSYHGIAFNLRMDLQPFLRINPCGFKSLAMTQLSELAPMGEMAQIEEQVVQHLIKNFDFVTSYE